MKDPAIVTEYPIKKVAKLEKIYVSDRAIISHQVPNKIINPNITPNDKPKALLRNSIFQIPYFFCISFENIITKKIINKLTTKT